MFTNYHLQTHLNVVQTTSEHILARMSTFCLFATMFSALYFNDKDIIYGDFPYICFMLSKASSADVLYVGKGYNAYKSYSG